MSPEEVKKQDPVMYGYIAGLFHFKIIVRVNQ